VDFFQNGISIMTETTGQQLLNARLARGETIDQASAATHVRPRYLQALETDDWASLPSVVQGKGFLRLYADYLALDPYPLLQSLALKPAAATAASRDDSLPANVQPLPEIRVLPAASLEPAPGLAEDLASGPEPEPEPVSAVDILPEGDEALDTAPPTLSAPPVGRTSKEIFAELGGTLQRQRELLSLSLAEVERHTHLRSFTLRALEEGRMEDMPSMVQARGMLANYARFLNLDGEALLLRFAEALQSRREELAALEESQAKPQKPARHKTASVASNQPLKRVLSIDVIATGFLVVALIGFVVWGAGSVLSLRGESGVTPTAPSVSDVLLAPTQAGIAVPGGTVAVTPTETATLAPGDATEEPPLATLPPTLQVSLAAGIGNRVAINLIASQRAWVQVSADGKVVYSGRLVPGNAYSYSGEKDVAVLTGNAAGFQVYFNNQDLGVVGQEGEVLNLIFTSAGLQKAAVVIPTSAVTRTPTKAATASTNPPPAPTAGQ
jgi:cytoskeletal protein RodZ